ncbi:MAG TPA: hypothetical protein VMF69_25820 [Gemmataceae bacterium]|nr:hypothetical protein [Gemmataceae bacterium]
MDWLLEDNWDRCREIAQPTWLILSEPTIHGVLFGATSSLGA